MAIERTGTAQSHQCVYSTGDDSGSMSLTVPSDCDLIVAAWIATGAYFTTTEPTQIFDLNGTDDFENAAMMGYFGGSGDKGTPNFIALEVLTAPDTGSQTLNWDWGNSSLTPYYGAVVLVSYYKGVDQDNPIVDSATNESGEDVSGMSYSTGDMMVGVGGYWNANPTATGSGQTQDVERAANRASPNWGNMGHKLSTGAWDGYSTSSTECCAAMVLLEGSSAPTEVEKIGTAATYYRPFYASDDDEGSRSITVPEDCDCIVATYVCNWPDTYGTKWYDWSVPFFKLGTTPFLKAVSIMNPDVADDQVVIIEVLPAPATGSGTLYWDTTLLETVNPTEGAVIIWDYYKGVDPDDPLVDVGVAATGGTDITGMSYSTGDLMVGCAMSDGTSSPTVTDNSQTQLWKVQAGEASRDNWSGVAYKVSSGAFYWTLGSGKGAAAAIVLRFFVEDAFLYRGSEVELGLADGIGNLEAEVGAFAGIGFTEEANQDKDIAGHVVEGLGFSALAVGFNASVWDSAAEIGFTEIAVGFNLSAYQRAYGSILVYSYEMVLTGAADGLPDYVLPGLKSIQIRMRSGDPSYLNAVLVYDDDVLDAVQARPNGNLVSYMIASANGAEILREALLDSALDTIRFDRGGESQSITLVGYRTQTFGGAAVPVPLQEVTSESMTSAGLMRYRCARPDFYLKPGDTAAYGLIEFTVDQISYSIAPDQQSMDVSE